MAGIVSTVRAQFIASAQGFTNAIRDIAQQTQTIGTSADQAVGVANNRFGSLMGTIGKVTGAYFAFQGLTSGLAGLGAATIGANADMETYQNTLTTLMKDEKKAIETLAWAEKFAASTPFEIPGIVDATAKLTAYGIDATTVMTDIGNMAAIMGKPLDQAVEAFADAQTGELERLKEFGITKQMLIDKAQKMYGVEIVNAKGQITDMEKMNGALLGIMQERYSGGMEIASKSFKGMISNVQDAMGTILREMSKPVFDKLKNGLEKLVPVMGAVTSIIKGDWLAARDTMTQAFGAETAFKFELFVLAIMAGVNKIKQFITDLKPSFENIGTIFKNLKPIITPVIGAIVLAFSELMEQIPPVLEKITEIAAAFTSWEGFSALLAGVVASFATYNGVVAISDTVTKAYTTTVTVLSRVKRALTAATIAYNIAGGGMKGIIAALRAAMVVLNVTMLANPFVLVTALLVGLGVALYTAYKKSETFRNAVDAVWAAMKNAWTKAWNWLTNFFTVTIPQWWGTVKQFFSDAWNGITTTFTNWVTSFVAAWNNFKASVVEVVTGFVQSIVDKFNQIKAFVMPIVNNFVDTVKNLFNNFVNNVKYIIEPIVNFFKNTFENLKLAVMGVISVFMGLFLGDMEAIKLGAMAIWEAIKRQITNIVTTFTETVSRIFTLWKSAMLNIWEALKKALVAIGKALWDAIKATFKAGKDGLLAIGKAIKDGFLAAWEATKTGVVNAAKALWNGAMNSLKALKDNAISAAKDTWKSVVSSWESMKTAAINTVKGMYDTVVSWFKKIPTRAKETGDGVVRTFKNINLKSIGKDIIMGLYNGLANGMKKVLSKAQEIADGIKSKIRKALDTHSPSRVMEDIGLDTGAGLVIGLDGMKKKVQNAAVRLASAMRAPMDGGLLTSNTSAVIESVQTIRHSFDLTNIPSHLDEAKLVDMLSKAYRNPKLQKTIDRINYKNNQGFQMPLGRA
jgi:phage-related protein